MAAMYEKKSNDRGVSESIGFLLIFTIVIAGIGLVTLYGYPMLLQQQVSADEKIMEKNMIVLQNDIKSLAYKTVPYKETSLKIGGGSLTVYNSSYSPSSSTLTIKDLDATHTYITSFQPGELRYESVSAQTDISLQNGAVVLRKHFEPGSVMLAEPRWFYDDAIPNRKTMVINLINITSTHLMAKEGIGTVRMKLVGDPTYMYFPTPTQPISGNLILTYTPDSTQNYSVAWGNYFTNTLKMTPVGTTYQLPPVDILVIKKYDVKIEAI
jgi:hypothetical protein